MQQMESSLNANIFPVKLWRLVNDCNIDAIVWNEQGDGIMVNKGLMEKEFFSLNGFKASSSSSFVRQLNFYGFKKSRPFNRDEPNTHHYFHPYFQRSQPELLPLLRRCNPKCNRMKEYIQTDLTERWREYRDLHDDDGYADLHNEKDLDEDQKEPSHLVTQPSEPTVPPEFPDSINGAGSSLEPHLPQSPLPQSDFGQHQGSSLITGFVPCHDSNQMGPPMEMDQGQNSTEVAELPLPSARQVEEHLPSSPSKPLHDLKPGNWIMIKNPSSRRRKHCLWVGPHQVLQTSDTHIMIAEGATWLDSSQFEKLS